MKYKKNFKFLQKWSSDLAYILGFIMADGHLNSKGLFITLNLKDICILKFIRKKISYNSKINIVKDFDKRYNKYYDKCRLNIYSVKLAKILNNQYGIPFQKTGNEIIPIGLPDQYFGDFVCGHFDGDGTVGSYKAHPLTSGIFCMSKEFLEMLKEKCGNIGVNIYYTKNNHLWNWKMSTEDSLKFKDIIYKNRGFCLKRKRKIFDNFQGLKIKKWTIEDISLLKDNRYKTLNDIGLICKRTRGAVSRKICKLGLQKKINKQWTKEELNNIINLCNLGKNKEEIATILNCSKSSIQHLINRYNLRPKLRKYWSKEEDQYILNNKHLTCKDIGKQLNRSWRSIHMRTWRLENGRTN